MKRSAMGAPMLKNSPETSTNVARKKTMHQTSKSFFLIPRSTRTNRPVSTAMETITQGSLKLRYGIWWKE